MIGLREPSRVSQEIQIFSANYHQSYFQTAETPLSLARAVFWLDLSGSHHWTFTLGCGELISGQISLDPPFLQPLQPSKRAKVAPFGCSGLFDSRWTIFSCEEAALEVQMLLCVSCLSVWPQNWILPRLGYVKCTQNQLTVQGYTKPVYCTSVYKTSLLINNVHKTSW